MSISVRYEQAEERSLSAAAARMGEARAGASTSFGSIEYTLSAPSKEIFASGPRDGRKQLIPSATTCPAFTAQIMQDTGL